MAASSLGANLVPDRSHYPPPPMRGGKYKSNLGSDLVAANDMKPRERVAAGTKMKSQLAVGALVPQFKVAAEDETPPPTKPTPKSFRRANLPPPPPPKPEPAPVLMEPRRCMFTGDDLPPAPARAQNPYPVGAPVTGERYQRWVSNQPHRNVGLRDASGAFYIYNQEDVNGDKDVNPPPAALPDSLQRLRELKKQTIMPETLDMHEGFHTPGAGMDVQDFSAADAEWRAQQEAAWKNEVEWRQWEDGQKKLDRVKRREAVDREIANGAVSAYGEVLPKRGAGDVFAPWAARPF